MDREKESPPERLPFCLDDTVGEIVRASQECPGVYYIAARKQDGKFLADEYYVVEKSSPAISKEAMAYGRMPEEDSRVLLYSFAEERRGYKIIEYEIYRYQVRHGIYADGQTSLRDIAFYNMEYHPEYFGPYDLTVANNSNVPLENFYLHDRFPTDCATAKTITTGTYNTRLNYQITYKTNYNDYRVLATNLLSTNNYAFDLSAISLMQDEVVTDVRLEFGKVPAGFASVVKPTVTTQTSANLANGYQVVNRADAGGQYMSQWETGRAAWITLIVKLNQPNLPKTGY